MHLLKDLVCICKNDSPTIIVFWNSLLYPHFSVTTISSVFQVSIIYLILIFVFSLLSRLNNIVLISFGEILSDL